jgi:hypothetical protein
MISDGNTGMMEMKKVKTMIKKTDVTVQPAGAAARSTAAYLRQACA